MLFVITHTPRGLTRVLVLLGTPIIVEYTDIRVQQSYYYHPKFVKRRGESLSPIDENIEIVTFGHGWDGGDVVF